MAIDDLDRSIRLAAFDWLTLQRSIYGDILPRRVLEAGFYFQGQRVPIVGPQGIFKPAVLPRIPLSITTIPGGPYDDDLRDGASVIHYRYRGREKDHYENVGVRLAKETQTPLVYCYCVMPGRYVVSYPVFVCGDDPENLTFDVQLDDDIGLSHYRDSGHETTSVNEPTLHRTYITTTAKKRLHQAAFRERVISAYGVRCALCRLAHGALLDAAHIIPDGEPDGEPEVSNGLALCKIHHAAFDLNYLGIAPTLKVEVRKELLDEIDGPMLQHGIKAMHGATISVPRSNALRPSPNRLEKRFEKFLLAARTT